MKRRIELDGCHNFRDLGGYPTADGRALRWRQLFRSDALHHLSPAGLSTFRDELGIGHVVDLRSTGELRNDGRGLLAAESLKFHHLPLFDGEVVGNAPLADDITLGERYFLLLGFAAERIARVLTTLAEADAPAVYHCAAGKDRTGVISAILLGLLGVRDEIIVADYAATQENLDAIVDRLLANDGYQEMLDALPPDTLHAEPETMIALLARIREEYGSMRDCVQALGVSDASIARLEERMLS